MSYACKRSFWILAVLGVLFLVTAGCQPSDPSVTVTEETTVVTEGEANGEPMEVITESGEVMPTPQPATGDGPRPSASSGDVPQPRPVDPNSAEAKDAPKPFKPAGPVPTERVGRYTMEDSKIKVELVLSEGGSSTMLTTQKGGETEAPFVEMGTWQMEGNDVLVTLISDKEEKINLTVSGQTLRVGKSTNPNRQTGMTLTRSARQ
ncbi:MAG: hypothetical protein ACK4P3_06160 [Fimbriimonadaceae bacterium]